MNKTTAIVVLVALVVATGLWFVYSKGSFGIPGGGGSVACTQEAKICPDGSSVGRTGPNCEFAACPNTTGYNSTGYGTIYGRVTLGPTCPVETVPPDPACAPKPYQTTVSVRTLSGQTVVSVSTDENGFYSTYAKAGTYDIVAGGGNPLPNCASVHINLKSDEFQKTHGTAIATNISCDTGIR